MNCPVCDAVRMREVAKEGVLIDICPNCKGVWLDRGELEKLMEGEREFRKEYPGYDSDYESERSRQSYPDSYNRGYSDDHHRYPKHKKKRRVFDIFEDLFD